MRKIQTSLYAPASRLVTMCRATSMLTAVKIYFTIVTDLLLVIVRKIIKPICSSMSRKTMSL